MKKDIVMIMEDDEVSREMLTELFKNEYKILAASNGKEGLEFFVKNYASIAVVLMDLRMPKMTGFEAAETIRAMKRDDAGKIPIIAISADAFYDDVKRCLDCGMNAHTPKPIDIRQLAELLEHHFRQFDKERP